MLQQSLALVNLLNDLSLCVRRLKVLSAVKTESSRTTSVLALFMDLAINRCELLLVPR